ncbi:MAG: FkbM family methyltransferase [Acidobacteriaceae bacterium]
MAILNGLKDRLLQAGPGSLVLLQVFRLQAAMRGISMRVSDGRISLSRGRRKIVLGVRDVISVPFAVHEWDRYFDTLEGEAVDGRTVLDFSQPAVHRYRRWGLSFHTPSMAEDDSIEAYTAAYRPKAGDVVWDVGAHVGLTTYFLAQMVGPAGRVFAMEPDERSYEYLLRNIELHHLSNVTPVKAALSDRTGAATFCMDGTMSAGLSDHLPYAAGVSSMMVDTLGLEDACQQFGSVPNYIKLDIEGAELSVVATSIDFLKAHPIHLSIESNHLVDGRFTSHRLEFLLGSIGYRAWSSDKYGQLFTWAEPATALAGAASR